MRMFLIVAFWACLVTNIAADDFNDKAANCMERIEREVSSDDIITLFIIDGTVMRGTAPAFMINSSQMCMWSTTDSGAPQRVVIPITDINKITYHKPSRAWRMIGLIAGAIAGWYVGTELAPEDKDRSSFLDFSEIGYGCLGVMVGGVTGAIIGNEVDKKIRVTVTLKCR
jgi:hypothetical protein